MKGVAKKALLLILKLLVSGSLLYFVLSRAGLEKVMHTVTSVNPYHFAGSVGIFILMVLLGSARWKALLLDRFPLRRLFPLYMLGSFFNIFMPGVIGGDAVKIYYLYRHTGKGAETMASVFMDRYMGYFALTSIGTLALPFGWASLSGTEVKYVMPAFLVFFVLASLAVFKLRIGRKFAFVGRVYEYFDLYRTHRMNLLRAYGFALCIQSLSVVSVYVLSLGMGLSLPFVSVMIFVPIISTLSALPLSISGIGIREAGFVMLFGQLGVSPDAATALSLLYFLSSACGALPGMVEYVRHKVPASG